jgi:LacI family transcriptional regulator
MPVIQVYLTEGSRRLLEGVGRFARERPAWSLARGDRDRAIDTQARRAGAAGLLGVWNGSERVAQQVARLGLPAVDMYGPTGGSMPMVTVADDRVGQLGAEHLMDCGYRRLAFCGLDQRWSLLRQRGFVGAARRAGAPCTTLGGGRAGERKVTWSALHGGDLLGKWLAKLKRPVGLMVASDPLGRRVQDEVGRLGWSVPDQLGLLGVDNRLDACLFGSVPMSSIDRNEVTVGYEAARLLDQMLAGEPAPEQAVEIEPVGVIPRKSTEGVPFTDPDLTAALQFMRAHADEGIGVEDVLDASTISRRTLERRFVEAIGRTPAAELRRLRLERAREQIISTDMPLVEVAVRSGFGSVSHLSKAFKSAYGEPPSDYRAHRRRR